MVRRLMVGGAVILVSTEYAKLKVIHAYICWLITVPDISMSHEAHEKICATPF